MLDYSENTTTANIQRFSRSLRRAYPGRPLVWWRALWDAALDGDQAGAAHSPESLAELVTDVDAWYADNESNTLDD